MWLAPNMVTLLGFMFILGNVALVELYVPDLVGPVRQCFIPPKLVHVGEEQEAD